MYLLLLNLDTDVVLLIILYIRARRSQVTMEHNTLSIKSKISSTILVFMVETEYATSKRPYFSNQTPVTSQPVASQRINIEQQQPIHKFDCLSLGKTPERILVPNGNVCDIMVICKFHHIIGHNGLVMGEFTLMISVIELRVIDSSLSSSSYILNPNLYLISDSALLISETNSVILTLTKAAWIITGANNGVILKSPKNTFFHWTAQGNPNTIIGQTKDALAKTSIQVPK